MVPFSPGQRVQSRSEPEMGLGIVMAVDAEKVTIQYPSTEEARAYLVGNNPLQRFIVEPGQIIFDSAGHRHEVEAVLPLEDTGMVAYALRNGELLPESELGSFQTGAADPVSMWNADEVSHPRTFDLRRDGWRIKATSLNPATRGLVGPRVQPLAHQLYIAKRATASATTRVLLADEVGLGKTIEALLIMSSLNLTGKADRILIVVPEALTMQWVAELYRRFFQMFSVLDAGRIEEERAGGENPFAVNHRVICPLEVLTADESICEDAVAAGWDLLIVDEAHHLGWNEEEPEEDYLAIDGIAQKAKNLLLLTATPKLYGLENLYGLLRLVDPARYPSFQEFAEEQDHYHEVAQLAEQFAAGKRTAAMKKKLSRYFQDANHLDQLWEAEDPKEFLQELVDRFGTGRVLFRNRREKIEGFPGRKFFPIPLQSPKPFPGGLFEQATGKACLAKPDNPRQQWLAEFLQSKDVRDHKVFVICSEAKHALATCTFLKEGHGIDAAVFHEEQTIVERDRQAAWFADAKGPRVLVASEIGGEGRNFQFAHKLVMLDIPPHPDLLEQRIGRLDRIGQRKPVEVYVPYLEKAAENVLLDFYHQGMESFTRSWNGADGVFRKVRAELVSALENPGDQTQLTNLIKLTKATVEEYRNHEQKDIDLLVDINSYDEEAGSAIVEAVEDLDDDADLEFFIRSVFDHFGIEYEEIDDRGSITVNFHSLAFIDQFPGLTSGEQISLTFDRDMALAREDMGFITYDHEIAGGALTLLLDRNIGVTSVGRLTRSSMGRKVFFQFLFVHDVAAPRELGIASYLPPHGEVFTVDVEGKLTQAKIPNDDLVEPHQDLVEGLMPLVKERIKPLLNTATKAAEQWAGDLRQKALAVAQENLSSEVDRLAKLAEVNKSIASTEVEELKKRRELVLDHIAKSEPRLDAIRVVLAE